MKLKILLIALLISLNLQAKPHNVFTVIDVGKLEVIAKDKYSTGKEFVVVFNAKGEHVFSQECSFGCNLFALTNNIIKIDGFDGTIYTKDEAIMGDGRWIESQGIVHLSDISTLSIPRHPNKVIGIIVNSFGTAGGSFSLYLIDIETGEVSPSKSLDWGQNKITGFNK